jgi:hypothetical protein
MSVRVIVYDKSDMTTMSAGMAAANQWGALTVPVESNEELRNGLADLIHQGVKAKELYFYTHGGPGYLSIGPDDTLYGSILHNELPTNIVDLFMPRAHVLFPGCEVAVRHRASNGLQFLEAFANYCLYKGGGAAGGWDSKGYAAKLYYELPLTIRWLNGTPYVYRFSGDLYYCVIGAGEGATRLIGGRGIDSPQGKWEVLIDGQTFEYVFRADSLVTYRRTDAGSNEAGTGGWDFTGSDLKITWPGRGTEIWDAPLFTKYQTGRQVLRTRRAAIVSKWQGSAAAYYPPVPTGVM